MADLSIFERMPPAIRRFGARRRFAWLSQTVARELLDDRLIAAFCRRDIGSPGGLNCRPCAAPDTRP
jgi:hypothetical protein